MSVRFEVEHDVRTRAPEWEVSEYLAEKRDHKHKTEIQQYIYLEICHHLSLNEQYQASGKKKWATPLGTCFWYSLHRGTFNETSSPRSLPEDSWDDAPLENPESQSQMNYPVISRRTSSVN